MTIAQANKTKEEKDIFLRSIWMRIMCYVNSALIVLLIDWA